VLALTRRSTANWRTVGRRSPTPSRPVAIAERIAQAGDRIANEFHAVTVDPGRGGGLSELVELRTGRSLLADGDR